MAEIRPFHGVHYNQRRIRNLAKVICPPYDIIPPQLQEELYRSSPYNFVRLEYSREFPRDTGNDNRYTRAASVLKEWQATGILIADDIPGIYIDEHSFLYQGTKYLRRGITACVRLEEPDSSQIRPHEGTLAAPKTDRLNLLWALQANTSSVFALFEDSQREIASLVHGQKEGKPLLTARTASESHDVWAITRPEVLDQLGHYFSNRPLYIADGHHRYESALNYRRQRLSCSPSTGDEPFNLVMMTLVDFDDPGLLILPPHRLVRGLSKPVMDRLAGSLDTFFEMEKVGINEAGVWAKVDGAREDKFNLALFGLGGEYLYLLKVRSFAAISPMMPYFHSDLYKQLAVSIADHVIIEELFGLNIEQNGNLVNYSYDRQDAVNRVKDGEYQFTVLVPPIKAEAIKAIADAGDRMPKKSTYFFPKVPAGLIFYKMS